MGISSTHVIWCLLRVYSSSTSWLLPTTTHIYNIAIMSEVSSKGWQVGHWIRRVLSRRRESRFSVEPPTTSAESSIKRTILGLPAELLLEIFSFMPLPSQVCLVLSSKRLHHLFGYVLGAEELRFPQMPHNRRSYIVTEEYNLRMALLIQLENETWACCGRCQRLHPRKEFSAHQLMAYHPWDRTCMAWAGIVDLCPCISLTIRDRKRIVEYLKAQDSNKPRLNLINNGVLSREPGEQCLLHRCTAYLHVQIEMRLRLTDSEQLTASTQYEAPNFKFPWREMDDTMPLCCSQVWLGALVSPTTSPWSCRRCHAHIVKLTSSCADVVVVSVARFLGRGIWFVDCSPHPCSNHSLLPRTPLSVVPCRAYT